MSGHDDRFGSFGLLNDLPSDQQADLLRALVDVIPDAVMAHGPDGDLVFWSDGVCALLGYTREEIRSLKPFGWVEPEAMRGAPGRLEAILHDGNLTFESRAVTKNGTVIPTLVTSRRLDTRRGPLIVTVLRDISSFKSAQDELNFLANHDALTGAENRAALERRIHVSLADTRRHGDTFALCYVDLDDFKDINDRFGHKAGDSVLVAVAHRLKAVVREQDSVARIASDEFAILLERLNGPDELRIIAERVRAAIAEPMDVCGEERCTTATVGFAIGIAEDTVESVILKADIAMYAAKQQREPGWLLWREGMTRGPARG